MIGSDKRLYKGISACALYRDISAALWLLMLLLKLTLSQLSEWAYDSRCHLPQNRKSKRDCYRRKQGGNLIALLCQSAAIDKVTSWISGKIWPWGLPLLTQAGEAQCFIGALTALKSLDAFKVIGLTLQGLTTRNSELLCSHCTTSLPTQLCCEQVSSQLPSAEIYGKII